MDFNWLWVVPVLGVLIIVHEMGHFFAARWLGIKVEEFGIGFPPRMFAIRRGGIDYSLNWLPIGGFVKIVGENGDSDDPASFGRAPAWKRIIVLAAGSFMNLLLAVLIFAGMSISGTREIDAPFTGVGRVLPGQPAHVAGMKPGDRIVSIAGTEVSTSEQIRALSRENIGKPTTYMVERDGKRIPLTVTPQGDPPLGIYIDHWVTPARVGEVRPGSMAEKAGLKSGDVIVQISGTLVEERNGERITETYTLPVNNVPLARYLLERSEGPVKVVVERSGQRMNEPVVLDVAGGQQKSYGFNLRLPERTIHYSPLEALGKALASTWDVISSVPRGIGQAFAGQAEGPGVTAIVGIGQLTGEVAQEGGINGLLSLTALLGISLFMLNLLPLPALDGGRLLFIFIELVRGGRRIAPEKEGLVHFAGMVVLLSLMLIITFFDVARLFQGERLLP